MQKTFYPGNTSILNEIINESETNNYETGNVKILGPITRKGCEAARNYNRQHQQTINLTKILLYLLGKFNSRFPQYSKYVNPLIQILRQELKKLQSQKKITECPGATTK